MADPTADAAIRRRTAGVAIRDHRIAQAPTEATAAVTTEAPAEAAAITEAAVEAVSTVEAVVVLMEVEAEAAVRTEVEEAIAKINCSLLAGNAACRGGVSVWGQVSRGAGLRFPF